VTKRFADVDLILLVDSAQQPMQAAPLALLRAAGSAGYADKVALAFSHFDQVKGDNLQNLAQKRAHVVAGITNTYMRHPLSRGHAKKILIKGTSVCVSGLAV
jgi:hypothetical protein